MRACYVNHHIVSRGRGALCLAQPRRGVCVEEQRVASVTASRYTIKDDISRPIYITREKERKRGGGGQREKEKEHSTSTRRVIIRVYVCMYICIYVRMCARRLAASSSFRYPLRPREIIRANDAKRCRALVETSRWTVHYIGILSGVDRRASAGSDYHLGHFLSRRTIGD